MGRRRGLGNGLRLDDSMMHTSHISPPVSLLAHVYEPHVTLPGRIRAHGRIQIAVGHGVHRHSEPRVPRAGCPDAAA